MYIQVQYGSYTQFPILGQYQYHHFPLHSVLSEYEAHILVVAFSHHENVLK